MMHETARVMLTPTKASEIQATTDVLIWLIGVPSPAILKAIAGSMRERETILSTGGFKLCAATYPYTAAMTATITKERAKSESVTAFDDRGLAASSSFMPPTNSAIEGRSNWPVPLRSDQLGQIHMSPHRIAKSTDAIANGAGTQSRFHKNQRRSPCIMRSINPLPQHSVRDEPALPPCRVSVDAATCRHAALECYQRSRKEGMTRPQRPCLEKPCASMALAGASRCRSCQAARDRARYKHPAHRALRSPRGRRCALQLSADCRGWATDWDHVNNDATDHRPSNRQPACRPCNAKKRHLPSSSTCRKA